MGYDKKFLSSKIYKMNKTVKYLLIYAAVAGGAYLIYKQYQIMQNKLDGDAALKKWNAQHN